MPASRTFQIFVKPVGATCNMECTYCYYLSKSLRSGGLSPALMPGIILEEYIVQHIEACPDHEIRFSWHGGEPTLFGLDMFRRIIELQRRYCPSDRRIQNGIQTNGTLLTEDWGRFLADEGFIIGLSLDGPEDLHDRFRRDKKGAPSFKDTMRGYSILRRYHVSIEFLCVLNVENVLQPQKVYQFFKEIDAASISFLPLVTFDPDRQKKVTEDSVPPDAFGAFLCAVFDEWKDKDIGRIKIQIFEEALRSAFGQEHSLCLFRETCGDIPVVEHNGDFYSCDHYVDDSHRIGNIIEKSLVEMLESPEQRAFGMIKRDTLPATCLRCKVLEMCHGGCPKNRFIRTPEGETGLNYLCSGYRRFFSHCRPFVEDVATVWRQQIKRKDNPSE